jgi:hypothetical protein
MKRKLKIKPIYECRCDGRIIPLDQIPSQLGKPAGYAEKKKYFFLFLFPAYAKSTELGVFNGKKMVGAVCALSG